jgi:EAL domain-containing protein (putative c-di-GMP-specific phosphodiesterase class I)
VKRQPILVVEDDPQVRNLLERVLCDAGHEVRVSDDAEHALAALSNEVFGVVVSDIAMPGLSGIDLLRELRRRDMDIPVVLVTGTPHLDTAVEAVECGAFRYLAKPVDIVTFIAAVTRAESLSRLARMRATRDHSDGHEALLGDPASLEARFELACRSVWMAFQPIVSQREGVIVAFEALLRTEEPTLSSPAALVGAAERLGRLEELGRLVRAETARALENVPPGVEVFVNLHAYDIADDDLASPEAPLSRFASRIVLELTERASLDRVKDAKARIQTLRELGFRIAIDDLGAGYAGLSWLATFVPEVVKIDMGLVRDVDKDSTRQRVVYSLLDLCRQLDIRVVLEGVETEAERNAIVWLGGDVMQGYHFARPGRGFGQVSAEAWGVAQASPG